MFDMQQVSKTISRLRKARNMTQMELADRLNISFQAVSNWERGQTMPDIAKLSELSGIFGVSIDELLGNGKSARVVEKLIREEPIEEEISAEAFLDVAPIAKPDQAEKLWKNVSDDISMKELAEAAPFISESMLDGLVVKAVRREKSFENMEELLPFISKEAIDKCMDYIPMDELNIHRIIDAAPFLGKKNINRLADHILEKGDIKDLTNLAPFMKKKKLTEAAAYYAERDGFAKILPLLPFLDKARLEDYMRRKRKDDE